LDIVDVCVVVIVEWQVNLLLLLPIFRLKLSTSFLS